MQLKDYIKSNKRGKEANRLERKALNDPFLEEALEGFETVVGDHAAIVDRLEKRYTRPADVTKPVRSTLFYWFVAATIMLILVVGGVFLLIEKDRQDNPVFAEVRFEKSQNEIAFESLESLPSAQVKESQQEVLPTAEVTKKEAPASARSSAVPISAVPVMDESISLPEKELEVSEDVYIADLSDHKVVVGYDIQSVSSESSVPSAVSRTNGNDLIQSPFGEKEFQTYCKQRADKMVCAGKNVSVKVTLFIDETGKPAKIEYQNYSCEDAKKEIENLLASSPAWTKKNRKVTMTIKW